MLEKGMTAIVENDLKSCNQISQELLEIGWETLHHGHWKDVPVIWRELYSYASLLHAYYLVTNSIVSI